MAKLVRRAFLQVSYCAPFGLDAFVAHIARVQDHDPLAPIDHACTNTTFLDLGDLYIPMRLTRRQADVEDKVENRIDICLGEGDLTCASVFPLARPNGENGFLAFAMERRLFLIRPFRRFLYSVTFRELPRIAPVLPHEYGLRAVVDDDVSPRQASAVLCHAYPPIRMTLGIHGLRVKFRTTLFELGTHLRHPLLRTQAKRRLLVLAQPVRILPHFARDLHAAELRAAH